MGPGGDALSTRLLCCPLNQVTQKAVMSFYFLFLCSITVEANHVGKEKIHLDDFTNMRDGIAPLCSE
jgi:hypothetical protein